MAYLNRIITAVPEQGVHDAFVIFAEKMLADPRPRTVFRRMVSRANIGHRYSFLNPQKGSGQFSAEDAHEFCRVGSWAFREEDWVRLLAAADVPRGAVKMEHWRPGRLCVGR
jgi:hypothetical protein